MRPQHALQHDPQSIHHLQVLLLASEKHYATEQRLGDCHGNWYFQLLGSQ